MIKALVFDADGTLIDSMKYWMELTSRYLKAHRIECTAEIEKEIFNMSLEEGAEYLHEKCKIPDSIEKMKMDLIKIIESFYRYEIPLKNGAAKFLSQMQELKLPMCIATAGDKRLLNLALDRLDVKKYFSNVFTCGELNTDKSKADIYLHAANYMNVKAEECLVFEDTLTPLTSAKSAGFKLVAIQDSFSLKDESQIKKIADIYSLNFLDPALLNFIKGEN